MSFSTAAQNSFLALLCENTAWANVGNSGGLQPSSVSGDLYLALHTASPGVAGNQTTNEATYAGYARVAIPRASGSWTAGTGAISNANAVTFPACTSGTETETYFSVGTSATGTGEVIAFGPLGTPITVATSQAPNFAASELILEFVSTGTLGGTAAINFGGAGALSGAGSLAGTSPVTFAASGTPSGGGGGGGATLLFNYNFATQSPTTITTSANYGYSNGALYVTNGTIIHDAGQAYYKTKVNIQSFTTDVTFSLGDYPYTTCTFTGSVSGTTLTVTAISQGNLTPLMVLNGGSTFITRQNSGTTGGVGTYTLNKTGLSGTSFTGLTNTAYGYCFVVQNDPNGTAASGDSNGLGTFAYSLNPPDTAPENSVIIAFDCTPAVGTGEGNFGLSPSMIHCNCNGLPLIDNGLLPIEDLAPQGFALNNADHFNAHIVYDGTILSVLLTNITTGAQAYAQWAVNIPAVTGADTAYIGFTGGVISPASVYTTQWDWYTNYNERLAAPTSNVASGQYTSTQTVTLSGPSGATIYYTTNGTPPTRQSSVYSSALTVSSNEIIRTRSGNVTNWEDSLELLLDIQIQAGGTPHINFPSGFASAGTLIATNCLATISGSNIELIPASSAGGATTGTAFYKAPVDIASFSTEFDFTMGGSPGQNSLFLIIQNPLPASSDSNTTACVSGGPFVVGFNNYSASATCGGYSGILASVGLKFDAWNGTVGLYTGGAVPTGSDTTITGGLSLTSGHKMQATVAYDGTTLSLTLTDTVNSDTFSHSWTPNIESAVGGSTAYVGFGASDYNHSTVQTINSWTYTEG